MTTYIIIYLTAAINAFTESITSRKDIQKYLGIMSIIGLIFISGTRYYLGGTDYYVYKTVFDDIPYLSDFFINLKYIDYNYTTYGMETGYLFLNSFIKTLGFNFFGFTLIHSCIFYILFFKGILRYTNRLGLVVILFLYKMFFYNTFISLRQSLTIAIFMYMLKYIEEKKIIKYFMGCLICLQIHTASIILFPIYFINRLQMTKKSVIKLNVIFIPLIVLSMIGVNVLFFIEPFLKFIDDPTVLSKATSTINSVGSGGISLLHTLEFFGIMVFSLINYERIIQSNPRGEFIFSIFLLLLPLFTVFRGVLILTRLKDYFTITYAILLAYIYPIKSKYNMLLTIGVIAWCALGFFRFIILFDNGAMMPYKSYIFEGMSIFGQ